MDIVLRIVFLLLTFEQTAHPFKVLFVAAFNALFVFPVCGNAVFRRFVHFPGTDLHLKGDALLTDDGGMQALIHIGLGCGNIILKAARNQIEQVMDMAENIITIGNGIDDDAEGI